MRMIGKLWRLCRHWGPLLLWWTWEPEGSEETTRDISNTEAIKNDIFDCGKSEHPTLFEKSKQAIIDYI